MKNLFFILLFLFFIYVISSCYYDNGEFLYPEIHNNNTCDTVHITFSTLVYDSVNKVNHPRITDMLGTHCASCHSNSTASASGGNIKLENYADVSAQSSRILGAINHLSGFFPMPLNGGFLDACSIHQFEIWVASGKPQ